MPTFTPAFMDELKLRADIVAVVSDHVQLRKVGQSHKGLCPFHKEKSPSFTVRADPAVFHCFGCGAGGDVIEFVKMKEGLSFQDAVVSIARRFGVAIPESQEATPEDRLRRDLEPVMEAAAQFYEALLWSDEGRVAREYLERRGFAPKTLERIRAGAAKDAWDGLIAAQRGRFKDALLESAGLIIRGQRGFYDRFRNRAIFPILSDSGKVVAFGARALDPKDEPKYLNSPETPLYQKSRTLYGLFWAKDSIRKAGRSVVMEGYLDVARAISAGVENAVAPCGTALTNSQARLLKRLAPATTLCFDGDEAGAKATKRGIEILLEERIEAKVARLEAGHDPDSFVRDFGAEAFGARIENAEPAIEWLAKQTASEVKLDEPSGKAAYMNALLPALSRIESDVERVAWIPRIARIGGIDAHAAADELRRAMGSQQRVRAEAIAPAAPKVEKRAEPTKSERFLISLAIQNAPEARDALLELKELDFAHLRTHGVLQRLLDVVESGADVSLAALLDALADDDDRRLLREIAVQNVDVEPLTARECVVTLRRLGLERRLAEIQRALKADPSHEEVETLLGEKVRVAQALAALA